MLVNNTFNYVMEIPPEFMTNYNMVEPYIDIELYYWFVFEVLSSVYVTDDYFYYDNLVSHFDEYPISCDPSTVIDNVVNNAINLIPYLLRIPNWQLLLAGVFGGVRPYSTSAILINVSLDEIPHSEIPYWIETVNNLFRRNHGYSIPAFTTFTEGHCGYIRQPVPSN